VTATSSHPAFHDPAVIERVLADSSVWAVVGLGDDPTTAAYGVAKFLQAHGKRIVPVHPRAAEVLGEQGYRTLAEIPFPVDVVDIFRRSDQAGRFVDEAVALEAAAVWMQLGVIDAAAAQRAAKAGLDVVMDTCPKIEWPLHGPHAQAPS
jgi:predicted CoA-binding protein